MNNPGYLRMLDDYARGGVSVVEIDLLRHPKRERLQISQVDLPEDRRTSYLTYVRRAWMLERWEVYTMSLRQPLPIVPIPLRHSDKDVMFNLQPLIERAYVSGGHDDIDYSQPCSPPLDKDNAAWAAELLKSVSAHQG